MNPLDKALHWKAIHRAFAVKEQELIDATVAFASGSAAAPPKALRDEVERLRVLAKNSKDEALKTTVPHASVRRSTRRPA